MIIVIKKYKFHFSQTRVFSRIVYESKIGKFYICIYLILVQKNDGDAKRSATRTKLTLKRVGTPGVVTFASAPISKRRPYIEIYTNL